MYYLFSIFLDLKITNKRESEIFFKLNLPRTLIYLFLKKGSSWQNNLPDSRSGELTKTTRPPKNLSDVVRRSGATFLDCSFVHNTHPFSVTKTMVKMLILLDSKQLLSRENKRLKTVVLRDTKVSAKLTFSLIFTHQYFSIIWKKILIEKYCYTTK